jgi:hypothetical protein
MKKIFLFIAIIFSVSVGYSQRQGIGVRLGNPMGLSYKKYFNKRYGLELGLGTAGPGYNNAYYRNSFRNGNKFEDLDYHSHQVRSTLYLQARYLIHEDIYIQDMEGRWTWYWGFGGVLKAANVRYRYVDNIPPYDESETYTDVDLGPEGIVGMEYTFEGVPITVFGDVSLMLEIVDRFTLQPFGGVGARYNF